MKKSLVILKLFLLSTLALAEVSQTIKIHTSIEINKGRNLRTREIYHGKNLSFRSNDIGRNTRIFIKELGEDKSSGRITLKDRKGRLVKSKANLQLKQIGSGASGRLALDRKNLRGGVTLRVVYD